MWKNHKERSRQYNAQYYVVHSAKIKSTMKRINAEIKAKCIGHYGGKCACCGETNIGFLTIDHLDGGGSKHRRAVGRGTNFYKWLIRNEFPDEYQVLCFNCNCGKQVNGDICPHKE